MASACVHLWASLLQGLPIWTYDITRIHRTQGNQRETYWIIPQGCLYVFRDHRSPETYQWIPGHYTPDTSSIPVGLTRVLLPSSHASSPTLTWWCQCLYDVSESAWYLVQPWHAWQPMCLDDPLTWVALLCPTRPFLRFLPPPTFFPHLETHGATQRAYPTHIPMGEHMYPVAAKQLTHKEHRPGVEALQGQWHTPDPHTTGWVFHQPPLSSFLWHQRIREQIYFYTGRTVLTTWHQDSYQRWLDWLSTHLRALSTDAAGQLDVLGHHSDALGMNGAQVGVLEQRHQVRLRRLLQGLESGYLEAEVALEVLGNLADETFEGGLAE
jgi:hypothetical protein